MPGRKLSAKFRCNDPASIEREAVRADAVLYNQPLALRFGTELLRHIDPVWDQLDIAVAWVRASGMDYLSGRFANFLRHGGALSIIVGIDLENTTREGLQALLDLEQYGACETFVYH